MPSQHFDVTEIANDDVKLEKEVKNLVRLP